jgi:methionine-rich copper-binding protein CopC
LAARLTLPYSMTSLRLRLPFAALLVAVLAATAASVPAERFHTRLLRSTPAKDSVIAAAPAAIELWFSEKVDLAASRVQLVDASAKVVTTAALTQAAGEGTPVVARITGPVADGVYTVNWSAASGDGHAVKGSFGFTVKRP